jgi:hypothetical protein
MPGRVLSPVFRAKLRDGLKAAGLYESVPKRAWKQNWVVHLKHAGTGDALIEYLSRYLFRPPISNQSIERFEAGRVTFRYRDGQSGHRKCCTVTSEEFIRRFLTHVLPRGFTRLRHYGCFSPGSAKRLAVARGLLERLQGTAKADEISPDPLDLPSIAQRVDPVDPQERASTKPPERRCPLCKTGKTGTMQRIAKIPRPPHIRCPPRAPP